MPNTRILKNNDTFPWFILKQVHPNQLSLIFPIWKKSVTSEQNLLLTSHLKNISFSVGQPGMEMNKMVGREGQMHTGEREGMGGHAHSHTRQAEHSPTYHQQEMEEKQKKGI